MSELDRSVIFSGGTALLQNACVSVTDSTGNKRKREKSTSESFLLKNTLTFTLIYGVNVQQEQRHTFPHSQCLPPVLLLHAVVENWHTHKHVKEQVLESIVSKPPLLCCAGTTVLQVLYHS